MGNQPHRERHFNQTNSDNGSDVVVESIPSSNSFSIDRDFWQRPEFTEVEAKSLSSFSNPDVKTNFVVALQDCPKDKNNSTLTIRKDEKLRFIRYNSSGTWANVEKFETFENGWVHLSNLGEVFEESHDSDIYLQQYKWYHGKIRRSFAEYLLNSGITGSFLVRESESNRLLRSISLRYEGKIWHFRISKDGNNKYYVTENQRFETIPKLVEYHSKFADGLPCQLLYPAPKRAHATVFGVDDNSDSWEIDRTEILMKHQLGVGQYGVVYEGYWTRHNIRVAVKTVKDDITVAEDFLEEARLMKSLQHPNLVRLLGVCTREPPNYIITEFMENGNLLDYLRKQPKEDLPPPVLLYMAIQIAAGMAYLEEHNFIHRDLAARNCLVGVDNIVKVADFGLARCMERDDTYTAHAGAKFPIKWTAPEGLAYNIFSTKSDVWAFGVLLWELATYGMTPYPGIELQDVYVYLQKGNIMGRPSGCPENIYDLMKQCWQWQLDDRPTFNQLHTDLEIMLSDINEQVDLEMAKEENTRQFTAKARSHIPVSNSNSAPARGGGGKNICLANNKLYKMDDPSLNDTKLPHLPPPPPSSSQLQSNSDDISAVNKQIIRPSSSKKVGPPVPPVRTTPLKDMSMTASFTVSNPALMEQSFSEELISKPENDGLPLPPSEEFLSLNIDILAKQDSTDEHLVHHQFLPKVSRNKPRIPKPSAQKSNKENDKKVNMSYTTLPKTHHATAKLNDNIKRAKSERTETKTASIESDFQSELKNRLKMQSKFEDKSSGNIEMKINENKQHQQQHQQQQIQQNDNVQKVNVKLNNIWPTRKSMGHIIKPELAAVNTVSNQNNESKPCPNQNLNPPSKRMSWTGPMSSMPVFQSKKISNLAPLPSSSSSNLFNEDLSELSDEFFSKETLISELNSIYQELSNLKHKKLDQNSDSLNAIVEKLETIHLGSTRFGNSAISSAKIKFKFIERCTSLNKDIETLRKYLKPFNYSSVMNISNSIKSTLSDLKTLIETG